MSWGQPEEVPAQQTGWGITQGESSWGNTDQQTGGWGNQGEQKEGNWGSSTNKGEEGNRGGGKGGRGGRGRGGGRGGRGGRDRGGQVGQGEEGNTNGQEQGGGWNQTSKTENTEGGGWGTTTQGCYSTENINNSNIEEGEKRGKGKRHESPPPVKRMRPNPIVIVVEDNDESETQHIIIQEYPFLQDKQKGLIAKEESQICYEGNVKIEDCSINVKFISFDTSLQTKINVLEAYKFENAKEYLKSIGEKVLVGIVEGADAENQKALNKLADNLVEKQQAICFQENKVNLFSVKQLYKVDTKSRLAFVIQI